MPCGRRECSPYGLGARRCRHSVPTDHLHARGKPPSQISLTAVLRCRTEAQPQIAGPRMRRVKTPDTGRGLGLCIRAAHRLREVRSVRRCSRSQALTWAHVRPRSLRISALLPSSPKITVAPTTITFPCAAASLLLAEDRTDHDGYTVEYCGKVSRTRAANCKPNDHNRCSCNDQDHADSCRSGQNYRVHPSPSNPKALLMKSQSRAERAGGPRESYRSDLSCVSAGHPMVCDMSTRMDRMNEVR